MIPALQRVAQDRVQGGVSIRLPRVSPLANRSVLVTGGTGTFGRAFVHRALEAGARRVAVFSRDELKQSDLAAELKDGRMRFLIGSVTDQDRLRRAMKGVELVIHAAALKQIPTCEANPWEAVATNVQGTQAVASAAIEAGVQRAVFLSTDKAAAPNTLYGATKLVAERLWIQGNVYAAGGPTRFAATRYGNVIGSRGSVVPIFRLQAKVGQLTVTDPLMTRFWMRLEQGVALVELALGEARGGEVFIPKAPAADILTVAEAVAPGVPWIQIGIRPGEKLHEMLISEDEARDTFDYGDHYRIEPHRTWEFLPPACADRVPEGFSYCSNTNPERLTVEQMREMIEAS